ncbi:MAG TPA: aminotransferase class V-fold PLP-dependent enzyme, partial [Vicinamibacteria bacterium]
MKRREWLTGAGLACATPTTGSPEGADSLGKADFPLSRTRTYLNNAAFHPMSVHASRAVGEYLARRTDGHAEPAWEVSGTVKGMFAELIGAKSGTVSYVTSTMVGENLVVAGLGLARGQGNVVTDALHFEGSLYLYDSLRQQGVDVRVVKPRDWRIDLRDLEQAIDGNTRLVAVSQVSYLNGFE